MSPISERYLFQVLQLGEEGAWYSPAHQVGVSLTEASQKALQGGDILKEAPTTLKR